MKRIVVAKQEEVLREEAQVLVGETITKKFFEIYYVPGLKNNLLIVGHLLRKIL